MIIPDQEVMHLELRTLGTFISAIAYGIVIILAGHCILLLHKKRATYSNRMRIFLFIYVTVMFLLSTVAITHSIWGTTLITFHRDNDTLNNLHSSALYTLVENVTFTLPLTTWGADGFMIWRCVVLYQDVSKGPRILVAVLLLLLSILSLASGVMFLIFFHPYTLTPMGLALSSTLVNIILASLISFRLVRQQRHIRKVLGAEHGSPYSKIITICVESSALIVIFNAIYIVLGYMRSTGSVLIPLLLLPHICVISPLLIVYRVAEGRATTTTLPPADSEQKMAQIRFNNPPSSQGDVTV